MDTSKSSRARDANTQLASDGMRSDAIELLSAAINLLRVGGKSRDTMHQLCGMLIDDVLPQNTYTGVMGKVLHHTYKITGFLDIDPEYIVDNYLADETKEDKEILLRKLREARAAVDILNRKIEVTAGVESKNHGGSSVLPKQVKWTAEEETPKKPHHCLSPTCNMRDTVMYSVNDKAIYYKGLEIELAKRYVQYKPGTVHIRSGDTILTINPKYLHLALTEWLRINPDEHKN